MKTEEYAKYLGKKWADWLGNAEEPRQFTPYNRSTFLFGVLSATFQAFRKRK